MGAPLVDQPSYRRAILLYLVTIVGPTLVLLYLGLESVQRQQQAITSLTATNQRLMAERVAVEVARRSDELAARCLQDPAIAIVLQTLAHTAAQESTGPITATLRTVKTRHPIADLFFIVRDNQVQYPRLVTPPPRVVDEHMSRADPATRAYAAQLAQAEALEIEQRRPDLALAAYRRSSELPVSAELKALALARMARCARKTDQRDLARQLYQTLSERHGDLTDLSHRPYAVVAGLELEELRSAQEAPPSPGVVRLARDLAEGRWDVSAEQFDYLRARLREHGGESPTADSDYSRGFELARALQDGFRLQTASSPGTVDPYVLSRGGSNYQLYYTSAADRPASDTIVGFAVDLRWIARQLFPHTAADLGIREHLALQPAAHTAAAATESRVGFVSRFAFWDISLGPRTAGPTSTIVHRDTIVFASSTALILSVLILGVVLLMRDVSRQLALGRLKSDFVSAVSHELKTPLTLIRLYADTLTDAQAEAEEDRQAYCQIIVRETERLAHLIDSVLDFARIDRRQKEYRLVEGDLGAVINRAVSRYCQYLSRRGFTVVNELDSEVPPVRFDPDAVSQAVLNLLDNAAKYSVDARFVRTGLRANHSAVVFEVEDHGIGIPRVEREKIFERFYRSPGASGKGGYGLGLFLVRHIMDAHGGRVEVDSEEGRGSRFRLVFPVSDGGPVHRVAAI